MSKAKAVWDDLSYTLLILGAWLLYIVFVGWCAYFFPEKTIIKNDDDLLAYQEGDGRFNRFVNEALETVIADTECLYPITITKRGHWFFAADMFTVQNAKCISQVGLNNNVTTTPII